MTQDKALQLIQSLPDDRLPIFGEQLAAFLIADLNASAEQPAPPFTESRARALLRSADVADEPALRDFTTLLEQPQAQRVALYDLLGDAGLADEEAVEGFATIGAASKMAGARHLEWAALALAAFAWQRQYPLYQFDPDTPPERYSPAGQILARAAHFMRRQVQRGATERDKLARQLAHRPGQGASLNEMEVSTPIPPLPPHFRPPVPVRYPEVARETLHVDPDHQPEPPAPQRGEPLTISEEDLPAEPQPERMPPLTIRREQVEPPSPPSPVPSSGVLMPASSTSARPGLTVALRQMFGNEELKTTRLHVFVQEYPDGPGLYGLQVRVSCKGIRSFVAGTTDRQGNFVAELPVRLHEGLTYDVDVTWPRDLGGETERKAITMNADRTRFTLPFYHHSRPAE